MALSKSSPLRHPSVARTGAPMMMRVAMGSVPAIGADPSVIFVVFPCRAVDLRAVARSVIPMAGLVVASTCRTRKQTSRECSGG